MARLREFDTDAALDSAMQAFWLRGYEATSLADLMAATGLKKGSIYKAFKGKHSLFMLALRRYLDESNVCHRQYLEGELSPRDGISQWMHSIIDKRGREQPRRGCLMLNSLTELAPHDEAVSKLLSAHFGYVQTLLSRAISQGQSVGEFRTDIPAEELSLLALNLLHGIVTRSKGPTPLKDLQEQAETVIKVLV